MTRILLRIAMFVFWLGKNIEDLYGSSLDEGTPDDTAASRS